MSDDAADGFFSRWSRRKRAAARRPAAAPEVAVPEVVAPQEAAPAILVPGTEGAVAAPEAAAMPVFDPASLPAPESLTASSDITGFLRAEVPAALRRAALRRVWTLDPGIRDFVGPADYAWDYNAPDGVPGFSLDLGDDAKKLLAQAMGWQPEAGPEDEAAPAATTEREVVAGPAAQATPPVADRPDGPVPEAIGEQPPAAPAAVADAAGPMPFPQRRHGGARPS